MGLVEEANRYRKRMFSDGALGRVVATRSSILGSPLSVGNDIWEIIDPDAGTIRTTVNKQGKTRGKGDTRDMTPERWVGSAIAQLPAIDSTVGAAIRAANIAKHMGADDMEQKDIYQLYNLIPIPRIVGMTAVYQYLAKNSGYPEKRPKKKKDEGE